MPKRNDYRPVFALEIFEKPLIDCDPLEQEFIEMHAVEFEVYQRQVARLFREAIKRKKKLEGEDYKRIFDYYKLRIPVNAVAAGIGEAEQNAVKLNKTIVAAGWFDGQVRGRGKKCREQFIFYLRNEGLEIYPPGPWGFNLFSLIKKGKLKGFVFDLWQGARRSDHSDHDAAVDEKQKIQKEIERLKTLLIKWETKIGSLKVKLARYYDTYENNNLQAAVKMRNDCMTNLKNLQEMYERL